MLIGFLLGALAVAVATLSGGRQTAATTLEPLVSSTVSRWFSIVATRST
jgi:hypothetical protein